MLVSSLRVGVEAKRWTDRGVDEHVEMVFDEALLLLALGALVP